MVKNMPDAIIDIPKGTEVLDISKQKPVVEVLIKIGDKTVYHNKAYSVVMNMVQSLTQMEEKGGDLIIDGDSQTLAYGHPVISFFAIDQLREKMLRAGLIDAAMLELKKAIKDPAALSKLKKQMERQTNKKL